MSKFGWIFFCMLQVVGFSNAEEMRGKWIATGQVQTVVDSDD